MKIGFNLKRFFKLAQDFIKKHTNQMDKLFFEKETLSTKLEILKTSSLGKRDLF